MSAHATPARVRAIARRLKSGATPAELVAEFGEGWQRLGLPTRAEQATPRWFEEHLKAKPHTPNARPDVRTSELSAVANSYLTRRPLFEAFGTLEDCHDIARAVLLHRGCVEPDALLEGVARKVYRTGRTGERVRDSEPVKLTRAWLESHGIEVPRKTG